MASVTGNPTTSPLRTIQSSNILANDGKVLKNTKTFENFSYFLGGIDVTHQNLDKFTPYIRGVSRIFLHKPPTFMNKLDSQMTKSFKTYLETGYKAVSGINDISVDFTTFEGGFAGQNFQTVQLARDDTESVTISVYELAGSPIREYLDTWVTGVRDPRSGIAHYHGLIEKYFNGNLAEGLPYGEINHTAEFIYTTYDPTGLALEYACMFAHCFPRRVPKDHLNYESGNRGEVQMDLEFSAEKYESPAINDIGIWYTQNSKVNWNYLDFTPEYSVGNGESNGYMGIASDNVSTYTYGQGRGEYHSFNGNMAPGTTLTSVTQLDPNANV